MYRRDRLDRGRRLRRDAAPLRGLRRLPAHGAALSDRRLRRPRRRVPAARRQHVRATTAACSAARSTCTRATRRRPATAPSACRRGGTGAAAGAATTPRRWRPRATAQRQRGGSLLVRCRAAGETGGRVTALALREASRGVRRHRAARLPARRPRADRCRGRLACRRVGRVRFGDLGRRHADQPVISASTAACRSTATTSSGSWRGMPRRSRAACSKSATTATRGGSAGRASRGRRPARARRQPARDLRRRPHRPVGAPRERLRLHRPDADAAADLRRRAWPSSSCTARWRPAASCWSPHQASARSIAASGAATWFWSFTPAAIERLFGECFGRRRVMVEHYGNVFAATAFLQGLAVEELDTAKLDPHRSRLPGHRRRARAEERATDMRGLLRQLVRQRMRPGRPQPVDPHVSPGRRARESIRGGWPCIPIASTQHLAVLRRRARRRCRCPSSCAGSSDGTLPGRRRRRHLRRRLRRQRCARRSPRLAAAGVPATLFLATGFVGQRASTGGTSSHAASCSARGPRLLTSRMERRLVRSPSAVRRTTTRVAGVAGPADRRARRAYLDSRGAAFARARQPSAKSRWAGCGTR